MRIVSWNCNGAFRRKIAAIEPLGADLLVIQECENPARYPGSFGAWGNNFVWSGQNPNRGIGVFASSRLSLHNLEWDKAALAEFLAVRVDDQFDLLAVWTQSAKVSSESYVGQACKYIAMHGHRLRETTVICGDFNSNAIWDKPRRQLNHSTLVTDLAANGFVSLYHRRTGQHHGEESTPTFYLYRKLERPYHIDYVFMHERLATRSTSRLEIGGAESWLPLSDHLPLIIDY